MTKSSRINSAWLIRSGSWSCCICPKSFANQMTTRHAEEEAAAICARLHEPVVVVNEEEEVLAFSRPAKSA